MGIRDRIEPFASGAQDARGLRRTPLGRLRRWSLSLVPIICAVVIISATQSGGNVDVENLWASAAFLLFAAGATAFVWRRVRNDDFEALRWRRLHRRVFWRAAVLTLLAGLVCLGLVAFWQWRADDSLGTFQLPTWAADEGHAAFFRGLATWLPAAVVPIVFVEPLVWRLWPRLVRSAVRRARVAKILSADRRYSTRLDLDPGLGAAGRPRAVGSAPSGEPDGQPHRITPHGSRPMDWPRTATDAWWHNAAIAWDGSALTLTDGQSRTYVFSVARPGSVAPEGRRRPVAELVWFSEDLSPLYRYGSTTRRHVRCVLLLDVNGRRVAELPAAGFAPHDVARVAQAAGLPFAAYDLGSVGGDERAANPLLFPGRRRAVKIAMPRA